MEIRSLIHSIRRRLKAKRSVEGYQGKDVALATLHNKERVIAPLMRIHLGARVAVASVDTDSLGTFSGEIERTAPPRRVLITKTLMGMEALALPRGIATEGSFGPHPAIPFLAVHHELMAFIDQEAGIEIVEQQFFLRPIYDSVEICSITEADEFLKKIKFGRYGVIVQAHSPSATAPIKGIKEVTKLQDAIGQIQASSGDERVRLLTDMRAHMNPLRMWRIRALAHSLAQRLKQRCPTCTAPGWGQTGIEGGLSCEECGAKTEATLKRIFSCSACRFEQRLPRLDGKKSAPVRECPWCNP